MGIIAFLSDLGSIGSTTKWAINLYLDLKKKNKRITDSEIFQMMIIKRYEKIELTESATLGAVDSYRFLVYRAEIAEHHGGLTGIIIDILNIEAELWKNDFKAILKMLEPLAKRMNDAKISKKTKYGPLEKFKITHSLKYKDIYTEDKWARYISQFYERVEVLAEIEKQSPGVLSSMFEASHIMYKKKNK